MSKQAKAKIGGDKRSQEYKENHLCEFTQMIDKPKNILKPEPKIDVKKELAKRIGTGEQTASRPKTQKNLKKCKERRKN